MGDKGTRRTHCVRFQISNFKFIKHPLRLRHKEQKEQKEEWEIRGQGELTAWDFRSQISNSQNAKPQRTPSLAKFFKPDNRMNKFFRNKPSCWKQLFYEIETDFDEARKKKARFLFCTSLQNLNGLFLLFVCLVYLVVKNTVLVPYRPCIQW
jgi:hypothetical protein